MPEPWITPLPAMVGHAGAVDAADGLDALLAHRPQLLERYRAFRTTLHAADRLPPRLLEACRLRVAAVHDCPAEFARRTPGVALDAHELQALRAGDVSVFDAGTRAALALADALPYRHHHVTDDEVARVRAALGEAGTVALLTAIAFFDVECRLRRVLGAQP